MSGRPPISPFFFFNDTATTEIYTLSLHDALPISFFQSSRVVARNPFAGGPPALVTQMSILPNFARSEEHTCELQSQSNLVCRLLLEKKKNKTIHTTSSTVMYHSTILILLEHLHPC